MRWTTNDDLSSSALHLKDGREVCLLTLRNGYWELTIANTGVTKCSYAAMPILEARRWAEDYCRLRFASLIEFVQQYMRESEPEF